MKPKRHALKVIAHECLLGTCKRLPSRARGPSCSVRNAGNDGLGSSVFLEFLSMVFTFLRKYKSLLHAKAHEKQSQLHGNLCHVGANAQPTSPLRSTVLHTSRLTARAT